MQDLAAGTSHKAVARRINELVAERGVVTAAEVFEHTPAEFQRLGSLVMMLDLALQYGTVDQEVAEQVTLSGKHEHELTVLLPHLAFHEPIAIRARERSNEQFVARYKRRRRDRRRRRARA